MTVVQCNLPNLENPILLVDEAHPEIGPVERVGEQGLQADKDKHLLKPLRYLADAPLECEVEGQGTMDIPSLMMHGKH